MTTGELIKLLQTVDPTGNEQVVVDGAPIYTVENLPAYWDGYKNELIQSNAWGYNIVGYRISNKGNKILLRTQCLSDVLVELMDISYVPDEKIRIELDIDGNDNKVKEYVQAVIANVKKEVFDAMNEEAREIEIIGM